MRRSWCWNNWLPAKSVLCADGNASPRHPVGGRKSIGVTCNSINECGELDINAPLSRYNVDNQGFQQRICSDSPHDPLQCRGVRFPNASTPLICRSPRHDGSGRIGRWSVAPLGRRPTTENSRIFVSVRMGQDRPHERRDVRPRSGLVWPSARLEHLRAVSVGNKCAQSCLEFLS